MLSQEIEGRQYVLGTGVDAEVTVAGSYSGTDYHKWLEGVASGYGYRVRQHGDLTIIENPDHTKTAALGESMASVVFPGSQALSDVAKELLDEQGSSHYDSTSGLVTATGPTDLIEEIVGLQEQWSNHTGGTDGVAVIPLQYAHSADVVASLSQLDLPVSVGQLNDHKIAVTGLEADINKVQALVEEADEAAESIKVRVVVFESTVEAAVKYSTAWDINDGDVIGDVGGLQDVPVTATTATVVDQLNAASISALRQDNDVTIVSEPQIVLSPGESASVMVGEQVPVPGDREITDDGREIQSIDRQDVGVSLDITARRYGLDGFKSDVEVKISEVREALDDELGVIIGERAISSVFTSNQCQPVFLGGLLSQRTVDNSEGIPGLYQPLRTVIGGSMQESLDRRYLGMAIEVSTAGSDCASALARRAGAPEEAVEGFQPRRKAKPGCSVL